MVAPAEEATPYRGPRNPRGGLALETSICSVNYSRMLCLLCSLLLLLMLPPLRLMSLCLLLLRSCPPLGGGQRGLPPLPPFSGRFRSFGLVLALMLLLLLQLVPLSLDSFVTSRRLRTLRSLFRVVSLLMRPAPFHQVS